MPLYGGADRKITEFVEKSLRDFWKYIQNGLIWLQFIRFSEKEWWFVLENFKH